MPARWIELGHPPEERAMWRNWRWDACPVLPGLYAIYERGRLVYIGSSQNLRARLRSHFNKHHWSRSDAWIKIVLVTEGWRERERRLVARLKPRDNRQWVVRPGAGAFRPGFW